MTTALAIAGWTLFGIAIIGALLLDVLGLFGNWIILASVAIAGALGGFEHFGGWCLPILFGLAVLGEVLETVAAGLGATKFGGGRRAAVAALVGCLLGAILGTPLIPIPIVGTILGACAGAFIAATLHEYLMSDKQLQSAIWVGIGAALGKVAGLFLKTFVGVAMLIVAALMF